MRWPGTATAHTSKLVGVQHKKQKKHLRDVNVSQTCVSSEKKLILARIGLFGDYEGRDSDLRVCKCQYPRHKNRSRKVEREVNLKMAEEIKAGGESSWW